MKMDIFFVVSTAAVFSVGLFVIVALFYLVRILKNLDHISKNVSNESDSVREDLAILRKNLREEGMRIRHFTDFFERMFVRKTQRKKGKKTTDNQV